VYTSWDLYFGRSGNTPLLTKQVRRGVKDTETGLAGWEETALWLGCHSGLYGITGSSSSSISCGVEPVGVGDGHQWSQWSGTTFGQLIEIVATRSHIFNTPNSISAGDPPQTRLGELTAIPRPLRWIFGASFFWVHQGLQSLNPALPIPERVQDMTKVATGR